ncbi:MAG: hypothetical protein ATN36_04135 [Epulopiscium sp. Nele67-Bin005]|nr:MAG: hypothetical protein ATN36_04135 [Epulopiscium sp. Nele67-Bin005]
MPDKFVIKSTYGCGNNIIVTDKNNFNIKEARQIFENKNNATIDKSSKILVETYLENEKNDLYDYKFWCFNGRVEYVMFCENRQQGVKILFLDRE